MNKKRGKYIYSEIDLPLENIYDRRIRYRAVASGALDPPVFGQSVNPISTRGADYTDHSTTSPPRNFRPCDGHELYIN
jgi:hypothetical protein